MTAAQHGFHGVTPEPNCYGVRHQLPHRIRIRFHRQLSPQHLRSLIWLLEQHVPEAQVRTVAAGLGVVISSVDATATLVNPLPWIDQALASPPVPLPEPPPTRFVRLMRQSHQGSLKVLMALAIAGWALPILPGTPFFLLAWGMGWRPEPIPGRARPGGRSAHKKSISSQGETTLAAWQSH